MSVTSRSVICEVNNQGKGKQSLDHLQIQRIIIFLAIDLISHKKEGSRTESFEKLLEAEAFNMGF